MKKMILATMVVMVGSSVALTGQSRDPRYDNRGNNGNDRYDDRYDRNDGRRYDERYDDRYDRNDGDRGGDFGVSVQVYNAPPPPPPPAYRAYRPACPGPNYIWVDGFWNWRGNRYAWNAGFWAPRPHVSAFWVAPRYDRGRYFSGYWGGVRYDRRGGFGYRR